MADMIDDPGSHVRVPTGFIGRRFAIEVLHGIADDWEQTLPHVSQGRVTQALIKQFAGDLRARANWLSAPETPAPDA